MEKSLIKAFEALGAKIKELELDVILLKYQKEELEKELAAAKGETNEKD